MQRGKRGEEMGVSIKPNKKKLKQAQRNKISLFDMILDLSVIKLVCMSLLVWGDPKSMVGIFSFLMQVWWWTTHYIDTLSSPQPLATFIPHALAKVELSCTIKWCQRQTFVLLIWGASPELNNKKYEYTHPWKRVGEFNCNKPHPHPNFSWLPWITIASPQICLGLESLRSLTQLCLYPLIQLLALPTKP